MALGAERTKVTAMIMRGAAIQAVLGLAIGLPIAWLCVRFIKAQLYQIKGIDAAVLLVSILTLALAASMAAFIPARRAASIDPAKALRTE
jgi:ABC-type antimicrobial peptide transport system permease subunit